MIVEKIRNNSLFPGTSVLPLVQAPAEYGDMTYIPVMIPGGSVVGFVRNSDLIFFRNSRFFSYTKVNKTKVLLIKGSDIEVSLRLFRDELLKKGIIHGQRPDEGMITLAAGTKDISITSDLCPIMGAQRHRVAVLGYVGRDRNCCLWMGRRLPTALTHPTKLQSLLSYEETLCPVTREQLASVAYEKINLQPDLYGRLRSAGLVEHRQVKSQHGTLRTRYHIYEIDLTDYPTFVPRARQPVEGYELISVKTILDSCHVGSVCDTDFVPIISFCIGHGIITPETDDNFTLVNQSLHNDFDNPFVLKK